MKNNKIRITSLILLVVTIVVAVYSNISMKLTKEAFSDMDKAFSSYNELYNYANSFEEGSKYLSEQARRYVINMNREYVDNYFREADLLKRRESSIEKLKNFSKTNQLEISLFEEAMATSKELEDVEIHAMALLYSIDPYDEPNERIVSYNLTALEKNMSAYYKQQVAYELLYSKDYSSKQDKIAENIKIGKNLIAENNMDINIKSVSKADAALELLSVYWGMFVVVAVGSLLFMNIYQIWLLVKAKKHSEVEESKN